MSSGNNTIHWNYIGRTDFDSCFKIQDRIREDLLADKGPQTVVLTEHERVFTFGRREKGENLLISEDFLKQKGFAVVRTTRGGLVTYHGPGQLVIYPIINLKRNSLKVKEYVKKLELSVIDALSGYGIEAERKEGYPGVWMGDKKIGSIGINVKKMVTLHGFALNVFTNLDDFKYINPCGFEKLTITSMEKEGKAPSSLDKLADDFMVSFSKIFNLECRKTDIIKEKTSYQ
jgi:lipoyl(octanoyl) transferase